MTWLSKILLIALFSLNFVYYVQADEETKAEDPENEDDDDEEEDGGY